MSTKTTWLCSPRTIGPGLAMLLVVDLMARAAAGQSTSSNADAGREANNPGSSPARVDGDGGSRDAGSPSSDKGDLAAHHPDVGDAAAPDGAKSETPEAANSGGSTPPASDAGATPPPPSQATPPEDTEGASELSTVVVTGTRRSERTVFESNVPVDVVAATSLHTVPSSDLNDKIAATVPSYSVQRLPLSDGAIFNRPATLRGLSPDQTLVLINGKRRHRSAYIDVTAMGAQAVDLAEIPLAAIDHVEVLRDGASAQYGSDAIAGVINIILKDKPGFDGYLQAGQYYAGDGANYLLGANQGFALGDRGSINISAEGNIGDATSRSNQRPNAWALIQNGNAAIQQPVVQRFGLPDTKSFLAFVNAKYKLAPAAELYAFGSFGYIWGENDFNWRTPTQGSVFTSGQDSATLAKNLAALPPAYQSWYSNASQGLLYPGGFTPKFSATSLDTSVVAGVRGDLAPSLTWDLSGRYGRNHILYKIRDTINASEGLYSPTEFNDGTKTQTEYAGNLDFNYLWASGLVPQPINVAFGAETRYEEYAAGLGDADSYALGPLSKLGLSGGSNGFFGTGPTQAGTWGRTSFAGYVDLDADLTSKLNVGAALRGEDYTDVGGTVNGKLSSRYSVLSNLNVRGAISTGFRAPTPGQANLTNTNQFPSPDGSQIMTNGTIPSTNPIAALVGGKPLKPEQSVNFSLGFVTEPLKKLTLSADGYLIYVTDRLGLSQSYSLTPDQQTGLVNSGVAAAQGLTSFNFFVNGFNTQTAGLDVVLSYTADLHESGQLIFTGAANANDTKILSYQAGVIGPYQRIYIEKRLPKYTENLSVEYDIGKFGIKARARNYGSWTWAASSYAPLDANGNLTMVQEIGERCFFDLSASYLIFPATTLTVGADNVFDTYTEKALYPNTPQAAAAGQIPSTGNKYPTSAPYPLNGGFYYARLGVKF